MARQTLPPVSLVFLAYNEIGTIEDEVREFKAEIVDKLPGSEFIVAEDGSKDGTHEVLQKLARTLGIVHLTSGERKGYRRALLDSIAATKNGLVFFCDTGRKHDAADFWKLYAQRDAADMIIGRKTNREDQWYRKLFTRSYNFCLRAYFRVKGVRDSDSGFRLFNRKVADGIFCGGKLFFKELPGSEVVVRVVRGGLRYCEVPVAYHQRLGASRGLPNSKIPKVIIGAIKNLRRLKKELKVSAAIEMPAAKSVKPAAKSAKPAAKAAKSAAKTAKPAAKTAKPAAKTAAKTAKPVAKTAKPAAKTAKRKI